MVFYLVWSSLPSLLLNVLYLIEEKNKKMLIVPPIQVFTQVFVISAMWLLAPYYTTHYYLKPVFIIFILYYIQYYLYM